MEVDNIWNTRTSDTQKEIMLQWVKKGKLGLKT